MWSISSHTWGNRKPQCSRKSRTDNPSYPWGKRIICRKLGLKPLLGHEETPMATIVLTLGGSPTLDCSTVAVKRKNKTICWRFFCRGRPVNVTDGEWEVWNCSACRSFCFSYFFTLRFTHSLRQLPPDALPLFFLYCDRPISTHKTGNIIVLCTVLQAPVMRHITWKVNGLHWLICLIAKCFAILKCSFFAYLYIIAANNG